MARRLGTAVRTAEMNQLSGIAQKPQFGRISRRKGAPHGNLAILKGGLVLYLAFSGTRLP
jgi:hypothetical protein